MKFTSFLKKVFLQNIPLKLFSLAVAVLVAIFIYAA